MSCGDSSVMQSRGLVTTAIGASPMTTLTAAESAVAPLSSVARAMMAWVPAGPFQECVYGALVATPTTDPPAINSTLAIVPSGSVAVAASATGVPTATKSPFTGDVSVTVGGWFASTAIDTEAEVVVAPLLSYAFAVSACVPVGALAQT